MSGEGDAEEEEEVVEPGEPEGFYIQFDSKTPVKPKPQLGRARKKGEAPNKKK